VIAGFGRQPGGAHRPVKRDTIRTDIEDESFGSFAFDHELATVFIDGNNLRFVWHVRHCRQMPSVEVERRRHPVRLHSTRAISHSTCHAQKKAEDARGAEGRYAKLRSRLHAGIQQGNGSISGAASDATKRSATPASI
jgi:hypothetical protein